MNQAMYNCHSVSFLFPFHSTLNKKCREKEKKETVRILSYCSTIFFLIFVFQTTFSILTIDYITEKYAEIT